MERPEAFCGVRDAASLRERLARLDGRGYGAYREVLGAYDLGGGLHLAIDHVQPDPFASPSRLRLQLGQERAGFPRDLYSNRARRLALTDFVGRAFAAALRSRGPAAARGPFAICAGGAEVLERNAVCLDAERVEVRFTCDLPARSRRILGQAAARLLLQELPRRARTSLIYVELPRAALHRHVEAVEDQEVLRHQLGEKGLVAFLADGAILPRCSGVSQQPLPAERAVPLRSPPSLRVTLQAPHAGAVPGLGIPRGVTLLCGGAFHGKSTLLDAIARCVYPHHPGDGRHLCVTVADAVTVRAEQGRAVSGVDIRPFLGPLPGGGDNERFTTENASGSTSQAASLVEALEVGARLLLLDEDTSSSNLLYQDAPMRRLLGAEDEPIVHLVRRVRQLSDERGVSTILVMGGSGEYFSVADRVLQMRAFLPMDVTQRARDVAVGTDSSIPPAPPWLPAAKRTPYPDSVDPRRGRRAVHVKVLGSRELDLGRHRLDLRALDQLVDTAQVRCIGHLLARACREDFDGRTPWPSILEALMARLERDGLSWLTGSPRGDLARPRPQEVAAALARLRGVRFRHLDGAASAGAAGSVLG